MSNPVQALGSPNGIPDPNSDMQMIIGPELQQLQALFNSIQGGGSIPSATLEQIFNLCQKLNTQLTNIYNGLRANGSGPDTDITDESFEQYGSRANDLLGVLDIFNTQVIFNGQGDTMSINQAISEGGTKGQGMLEQILIQAEQGGFDGSMPVWLQSLGTLVNDTRW